MAREFNATPTLDALCQMHSKDNFARRSIGTRVAAPESLAYDTRPGVHTLATSAIQNQRSTPRGRRRVTFESIQLGVRRMGERETAFCKEEAKCLSRYP